MIVFLLEVGVLIALELWDDILIKGVITLLGIAMMTYIRQNFYLFAVVCLFILELFFQSYYLSHQFINFFIAERIIWKIAYIRSIHTPMMICLLNHPL